MRIRHCLFHNLQNTLLIQIYKLDSGNAKQPFIFGEFIKHEDYANLFSRKYNCCLKVSNFVIIYTSTLFSGEKTLSLTIFLLSIMQAISELTTYVIHRGIFFYRKLYHGGTFSTIYQGQIHSYAILTTNLYDKSQTIQHQKDMLSK